MLCPSVMLPAIPSAAHGCRPQVLGAIKGTLKSKFNPASPPDEQEED